MQLARHSGVERFIGTDTIRSTETRQQCTMELLLNILYEGQEGRGYFVTGTGLHKAFDNIIKGMPYDVAEEMMIDWMWTELDMFETAGLGMMWTKARPYETWERDSIELLNRWYHNVHPDGAFRQQEFNLLGWPPKSEVWLDVETPDFHLRTQVDAIFNEEFIVDWKTGANKGADDRQLHVYMWAAKQLGLVNPAKGMPAAFFYVDHQEFVPTKMPYPGDEAIYEFIAEAERRKKLGKYFVEPSWKCKWCQVTEVCPAWADNESLPWPELMELAKKIEWTGVNDE